MSQLPPSDHAYGHDTSRLHRPQAPRWRHSAEFFPVLPEIEEYKGIVYWVDGPGVSSCAFEKPLVDMIVHNSGHPDLHWVYGDLTRKLERAAAMLLSEAEPAPNSTCRGGPGFWRVDNTIIRDDNSYVRAYEFGGLSFDIMVPNNTADCYFW